jgi:hypothetical protein
MTRHSNWHPDDSTSLGVIDAVASELGVDETALPPLYESISPDALDALFDSGRDRIGDGPLEVRFTYASREIVVRPGGVVEVHAPEVELG